MKPKVNLGYAVFFVIGGFLTSFAIFALFSIGKMGAGMSDGIGGGVESPQPYIMIFAAYFVCGVVASVLPLRDIRIVLAATAHVAPFGAVWLLRHGGAAAMGIVCLPAFIIFAVYSFTWISMLSEKAYPFVFPIPVALQKVTVQVVSVNCLLLLAAGSGGSSRKII
jgi:hypothetical protein